MMRKDNKIIPEIDMRVVRWGFQYGVVTLSDRLGIGPEVSISKDYGLDGTVLVSDLDELIAVLQAVKEEMAK